MGSRGPAPRPSTVHMLNGNPGKRSQAAPGNGSGPAVAVPVAPEWLLSEARAEWDRITPELETLGLISELDLAHLAAYCQAFALMERTGREIKRLQAEGEAESIPNRMRGLIDSTPSGYKQLSALMSVYNRACDQMAKHAAEFGLSPSARQRVQGQAAQGSLFPDADPMAAFLAATAGVRGAA